MPFEDVRRQCEALYYNGTLVPTDVEGVSEMCKAVGVHPAPAVVERQWEKLHRRLAATVAADTERPSPALAASVVGGAPKPRADGPTGAAVPFNDVVAVVSACYFEQLKVDPTSAEDHGYLSDAWVSCGGLPGGEHGGAVAVGTVSARAVAETLSQLGVPPDAVTHSTRRGAASRNPNRSLAATMTGVDPDALSYKEFGDLGLAHDQYPDGVVGGTRGAGGGDADDLLNSNSNDESFARPRVSFMMMMRVKAVVRNMRRRLAERREMERKERELDAFARQHFDFDIALFDEAALARQRQQHAAAQARALGETRRSDFGSTFRAQSSQQPQPAVGGALFAARARRSLKTLPAIVDEDSCVFERVCTKHDADARRRQRAVRQSHLSQLQKSHPRKDRCLDIVKRYKETPVTSPLGTRLSERASTPFKSTWGRPTPAPLSPAQLRQRRTPTPGPRPR